MLVFPLKNDSSHVEISYDKNQIEPYTLYQKIQSIGYKVHPKLENISRAYLRVQGMHCNSCVMNITETVEDLPGVHHVKVSFDDQVGKYFIRSKYHSIYQSLLKKSKELDFQVAIATNDDGDESKSMFIKISKE